MLFNAMQYIKTEQICKLRYDTLRYVKLRCVTTRYVKIRYVTIRYVTLLHVTIRFITVIFNAFSFVFAVENKKQREQDRISDESKHSEKPSGVVDRSFLILPCT